MSSVEVDEVLKLNRFGDGAIHIRFGDGIDYAAFRKVQSFVSKLKKAKNPIIIDWIPTYNSVTLLYSLDASFKEAADFVQVLHHSEDDHESIQQPEIVEIPVCYEGNYGPDLPYVADFHKMSISEVIERHTAPLYLVYMVGFMPGFPYLGGLDNKLSTPRQSTPRLLVPGGSVGIAGNQTGLYPFDAPGGWQIIGRTPKRLFDVRKDPPSLLKSGASVKFKAVNQEEFESLKETEDECS